MTEKKRQTSILNYLKLNNIYHFRKFQMGGDKKGVPDIIACYRGFFIGIEVKTPYGSVISKAQEKQKKLIEKAGGYHIYATNWKDIQELINKIDEKLNEKT